MSTTINSKYKKDIHLLIDANYNTKYERICGQLRSNRVSAFYYLIDHYIECQMPQLLDEAEQAFIVDGKIRFDMTDEERAERYKHDDHPPVQANVVKRSEYELMKDDPVMGRYYKDAVVIDDSDSEPDHDASK